MSEAILIFASFFEALTGLIANNTALLVGLVMSIGGYVSAVTLNTLKN